MRRTALTIVLFIVASVAVVGLLSFLFISGFQRVLPSRTRTETKSAASASTTSKMSAAPNTAKTENTAKVDEDPGAAAIRAEIGRCCQTLDQNGRVAPNERRAAYVMAASLCEGIKKHPEPETALKQIRTALRAGNLAGACQELTGKP
jgi:hypothetical protein